MWLPVECMTWTCGGLRGSNPGESLGCCECWSGFSYVSLWDLGYFLKKYGLKKQFHRYVRKGEKDEFIDCATSKDMAI